MTNKVLIAFLALSLGPGAGQAHSEVHTSEAEMKTSLEIIQGLQSADCPARWKAIRQALQDARHSQNILPILQKELDKADKVLQTKLVMLIAYVKQKEEAFATGFKLRWDQLEQISKIKETARRTRELNQMRRRLLDTVNDPKAHFSRRLDAADLMYLAVTEFYPTLARRWMDDLSNFLKSTDPQVRLIGSLLASSGFPPGREPAKGAVIPVLIKGLRAVSFDERYLSLHSLELASEHMFCVDPTDPSEMREEGIQRWEEWWNKNKDRLSREKLSP